MVIRIFFAVLVLCTVAVVAVILAVHFRVKRHLQEQTTATPEAGPRPDMSTAVTAPADEVFASPPVRDSSEVGSP